MYFAIRVAVGSAIMIAFYLTRGFGSKLETFVMAFAASLAAQGVALGVKMIAGDTEKSKRSVALLGACVIAFAASVVFVVVDKQNVDRATRVQGVLDKDTLRREGDTYTFTIVDGEKRIPIRYSGVLSDQVRDRMEISARGVWRGKELVATDVLAKCPTTYNTPNGPAPATQFR